MQRLHVILQSKRSLSSNREGEALSDIQSYTLEVNAQIGIVEPSIIELFSASDFGRSNSFKQL